MYCQSHPIISPKALRQKLPLPDATGIQRTRQTIVAILNGHDPRLLLIVGPCSIHDPASIRDYACRLQQLQREVEDHFFIVMRAHYEKPRTVSGWKGFVYTEGLEMTRELLLDLVAMEMPLAAEILDPHTIPYFYDLLSWGCIGARTVSSQIHRQLASGLPFPVGFKNSTEGSLELALNGLLAAKETHTFFGIDDEGRAASVSTTGNHNTHLVLRGGRDHTNYDAHSLAKAEALLTNAYLPKRLVVDCSHGNSAGCHDRQPLVFRSVLDSYIAGDHAIRGLILESFLEEGAQKPSPHLAYGLSITDPCLSFATTEQLLLQGRDALLAAHTACHPLPL